VLDFLEMASSSRSSRNNLGKVDNKFETVTEDIRRPSTISFKFEEDLNMRRAKARRPSLMSILSSRVRSHSVFSTTSINTVNFRQMMNRIRIMFMIILILIFCIFLFTFYIVYSLSQELSSNYSSTDDQFYDNF